MKNVLSVAFMAALVCGALAGESKESFPLISKDGTPVTIVAPETADLDGPVAELRTHLSKIAGIDFPVQRGAANEGTSKPSIVLTVGAGPEREDGFDLEVTGDAVHISSRTAQGVGYGVAELLEQLGVRWFMPGELGTVIPAEAHPRLAIQKISQVPFFKARYFAPTGDPLWDKRLRFGGTYFPPSHEIPLGKGINFETHPELYSLEQGKRTRSQLCISNPEVLRCAVQAAREYFDAHPEKTIYGMGPRDGSGFCECPACRALDGGDWDPFSGEPSVTDRYLWFFNRFLEELDKTHPGKSVAFYAYHSYMRLPVKTVPNPRILPALAPIALCRIHGMDNPVCPDRSYYRGLMTGWAKLLPQVFERGYWFNLADPGLPFSSVSKMRDEIPAAAKAGIYGWRVEVIGHWASELPSHYIGAKLMWDPGCDVDALLADFYDKFFGPASAPMKTYFETMDHALRDGDHHTGGAFYAAELYTPEVRKRAGRALRDAAASVNGKEPYRSRVELVARSFDYLQEFVAMLDARDQFQWDKAMEHWNRIEKIREELVRYDPPMLNPKLSRLFLDRFFKLPVAEGYARSHDGNRVVATLGDQWEFLIDPAKVGADLGYPVAGGGNWRKISAYKTSWSDNGLHYYRGLSWYRQTVKIGKEWQGQRVFLWFGGVDETARVWVNGTEVGISADAAFAPFEFDATAALRPGQDNQVVVCVANNRTDEIGTGGIMAPVMFYSPAGGEKAVPQNSQPLRHTFP